MINSTICIFNLRSIIFFPRFGNMQNGGEGIPSVDKYGYVFINIYLREVFVTLNYELRVLLSIHVYGIKTPFINDNFKILDLKSCLS